MSNVHQLPDASRVEQEAGDWIARLQAEDVSDEDRVRFETWRRANALNARTFDALAAAWRAFAAAGPMVRAVSFGQAMNAAGRVASRRRRWVLGAGAVAAAVAITAITLYLMPRPPESAFQTAIGEHASVSLPDGSTLELNSNSLARVDYSQHARVVHLERGEAFFQVAHDTARPFFVVGGGSWVRAVGTAFNVYLHHDDVLVTVSEGTVQVGRADSAGNASRLAPGVEGSAGSVLKAGQQVDVEGGTAAIRTLANSEVKRTTAWRTGTLYFEKQPLSAVIEELGRYTPLEIVVSDEALRRLPIGGSFQASPEGAETLLAMLRDGLGLRIRRDGARALIEPSSASAIE